MQQQGSTVDRRPARLATTVAVLGVLLSVTSALTAARSDRDTEERLLQRQTAQAASVLAAAVGTIEARVRSAAELADELQGTDEASRVLTRVLDDDLGEGGLFVSASIWRVTAQRASSFVSQGEEPLLAASSPQMDELVARAVSSSTVVVDRVGNGSDQRIAYAYADPADRRTRTTWVAYAERAIPADRRAPVDRDDAYQGLDYAIYLGSRPEPAQMTTTNVDPGRLPLDDDPLATAAVPFGDTVLTLTATPGQHLGSGVSERLPWIRLVGGLALSLLAGALTWQLGRARRTAEADTATIRTLYERVDALYDEQRNLFFTLQRALLPRTDPGVPDLEVAADYVAGATGVDIGGDWYSVIRLEGSRFAFVVGDVSGRGVDAVAEMARARFTLRAYLAQGDTPAQALTRCSAQFDAEVDDHIITAVVGLGDSATGELALASAGHPPPLLVEADGHARFLHLDPGPPLGTGATEHTGTDAVISSGSTLIAYTDGLVERRDKHLDDRLEELRTTAIQVRDRPTTELVAHLLAVMRSDDAPDDIAVLALRRTADPS